MSIVAVNNSGQSRVASILIYHLPPSSNPLDAQLRLMGRVAWALLYQVVRFLEDATGG